MIELKHKEFLVDKKEKRKSIFEKEENSYKELWRVIIK